MKVIKPSFEILDKFDGLEMLKSIERAGRTCYKSEDKICEGSAVKFVKFIISRGHESVLEHEKISVRIICDRGVSHEIVRHRIASYSQESTRYCNYSSQDIQFIKPFFDEQEADEIWIKVMEATELAYKRLCEIGVTPQIARSVLPNSLKTELVMTCNLREWRHFFRLRTSRVAHPQMREIACPMLDEFKKRIPVIFEDINY